MIEIQRTPLPRKRWERKWNVFNIYFNKGYYVNAAFQAWAKEGSILLPQFVVITDQRPDIVRSGFAVKGSEMIVTRNI